MHTPTICDINRLYGLSDESMEAESGKQRKRYEDLVFAYLRHFGGEKSACRLFSAPGRTEIGGNHTDHNGGKVLTAAVNLDIIAAVEPLEEGKIVVKSEGREEDAVYLDSLDPIREEKYSSAALIRGVADGFVKAGLKIGGFKAYTTSQVSKGSGLSSSAAFETLIGIILSHLYNEGKVEPAKIAHIAGAAENDYFGKPCGLTDQITSAVGGFVAIDFKEDSPVIESVKADLSDFNHALCIIDTRSGLSDLTEEYAAVDREMKQVAAHFDVDCLRRVCKQDIILNINTLRAKFGDRAVLRSLHFFDENDRVDKLVHALETADFAAFLGSVNESGNSSYKYLQNIFFPSEVKTQPLGIGLNIAETSLARKGACRVHGGGFAGTVQAFVPFEILKEFKMNVEVVFGANACHIIKIRDVGITEVTLD